MKWSASASEIFELERSGDATMAGLVGKLLDFPAFLVGFMFLYWSLPLSALLGKFSCWRFQGKVNFPYDW